MIAIVPPRTHAEAITVLERRHAELVAAEADLSAQATSALDCAALASNAAAQLVFLRHAREIMDDRATVRGQINQIEACWS